MRAAAESIRSSTDPPSVAVSIAAHVPTTPSAAGSPLHPRGRAFVTVGALLRRTTSVPTVWSLLGSELGVDVLGRGFQSPVRLLVIR